MGIFKDYQQSFYHREGSNDIRKLFCMKLVNKLTAIKRELAKIPLVQ